MDVREKLVELLEGLFVDYGATAIFFTKGEAEVIADHLIAHAFFHAWKQLAVFWHSDWIL